MGKDDHQIRIAKAKGRPMLTWVGKRPLTSVRAYPAQHVESFAVPDPRGAAPPDDDRWADWPEAFPRGGLLFHGDNKDVLAHLLANGFRGKVKLIYIDPPFDSGADYVRKVELRGAKGTTRIDGEEYTLGEQIQYTDIWANDNYLQFMYERLSLLKELLTDDGSLYLHCDPRKNHLLRVLLDEIFGSANFVSEIVWQSADAQSSANRYGPIHNTILYYSKNSLRTWNPVRSPLSKTTADNWYTNEEVANADIVNKLGEVIPKGTIRRFNKADLTARKPGGDTLYEWKGVRPPSGRYWAYSRENMEEFERQNKIVYSESGRPYLKRYLDEVVGTPPQDLWTDVSMIRGISRFDDSGYPTEKPEGLLSRIIKISSNPADIVLDSFMGSGTAASAAQKLGRRWIGCDINKGAIQTTAKRLQAVMQEQATALAGDRQAALIEDEAAAPPPAQLGFNLYRVNDYDLQIQHNEAVALACEHIGITRTRADGYFDGTLGGRLAKIIPLNHPLTPMDLEDLREELRRRPEEERDITLVCLGMELAARAWIEEYNRSRPINKLHVIELRTDRKYGGFITHEPLTASVRVERVKDRLEVTVNDVFSPGILQRLNLEQGVFRAQIEDWRAVVDCIMIDTDYGGEVFNVALSDIPARRQDLVEGRYELPAPPKGATVAVKIIDMLGEEVIVTATP